MSGAPLCVTRLLLAVTLEAEELGSRVEQNRFPNRLLGKQE